MPKRKRTTALFDVMSVGKSPAPLIRTRSWLQSPSWSALFKSRKPAAPRPVAHVAPRESKPVYVEPEPVAQAEPSGPPRAPWYNRFKFDWDATNGTIAVSAVVIVVGLGILIAHKFQHQSLPTLAALSSTDGRKQPVRSSVLDVSRRPAGQQAVAPPPVMLTPNEDTVAKPAGQQAERVIGVNYVIMQTFSDEKLAQDAVDALKKNGLSCSVIAGLGRWAPNPHKYTVVGLKGFSPRPTGTPEFEAYLAKVRDVNASFAGKSKWNQLKPQLYQWGADSDKVAVQ